MPKMKKFIIKFVKGSVKTIVVLAVLLLVLFFFGGRDFKKLKNFCNEMKPGLDVNQIHVIAEKYDVGFKSVRDPKSVKNKKLGIKLTDKENTWLFVVMAPMTVNRATCGVYHNNQVVLSADLVGG